MKPDLELQPGSKNIRYRHVRKGGMHFYLLFNEKFEPVSTKVGLDSAGTWEWWNPSTGTITAATSDQGVAFEPGEIRILCVKPEIKLA